MSGTSESHVVSFSYFTAFIFFSLTTSKELIRKSKAFCLVMWDFPLYAMITINEERNCHGPLIGQNLGRQRKRNGNGGRKEVELGEKTCSPAETDARTLAGKL